MTRVLIVEDDDDVRQLLVDILTEEDYSVTQAATYNTGIDALASGSYDLVISDLLLPDGSGRDLINEAEAKRIRTLLITGHPDPMQAFDDDGTLYVPKPFGLDEILERVAHRLFDAVG